MIYEKIVLLHTNSSDRIGVFECIGLYNEITLIDQFYQNDIILLYGGYKSNS